MSTAALTTRTIARVVQERLGQIFEHGHKPETDSQYPPGTLVKGALAYLALTRGEPEQGANLWPFGDASFKRHTPPILALEKACAMLMAEHEAEANRLGWDPTPPVNERAEELRMAADSIVTHLPGLAFTLLVSGFTAERIENDPVAYISNAKKEHSLATMQGYVDHCTRKAGNEPIDDQVDRLATFLLKNGGPVIEGGAIDNAIELLKRHAGFTDHGKPADPTAEDLMKGPEADAMRDPGRPGPGVV